MKKTIWCYTDNNDLERVIQLVKEKYPSDELSSREVPNYAIALYEHANYEGRVLTLTDATPDSQLRDFNTLNFYNIASSILRPSSYNNLGHWVFYEGRERTGRSLVVPPRVRIGRLSRTQRRRSFRKYKYNWNDWIKSAYLVK